LRRVNDNLYIAAGASQTSLDGLGSLEYVRGTATFFGDGLTSLAGLTGLASVGALQIGPPAASNGVCPATGRPNWTSLAGLESLTSLGAEYDFFLPFNGRLQISCNPLLTDVSALANLLPQVSAEAAGLGGTTPGETNKFLILEGNASLTDLSGFEGLTHIYSLEVNNTSLQSLTGLDSLQRVESYLTIEDNAALANLNGLGSLEFVSYFEIEGNTVLANISSLQSLATIENGLSFTNNQQLSSLDGLEGVTTPGQDDGFQLWFSGSHGNLTDISALSGVTHLSELTLYSVTGLTDLNGLQNVETIGSVIINGQDAMTSLNGLDALQTVETTMSIDGCDNLASIAALSNLTSVGRISLWRLPVLASLDGLQGVQQLTPESCGFPPCYTLRIEDNDDLVDLTGLDNLVTSAATTRIANNQLLQSLDGLDQLTTAYTIEIVGNPSLIDVTALSGVSASYYASGVTLTFDNNPNLTSLFTANLTELARLNINRMVGLTSLDGLESVTVIRDVSLGTFNENAVDDVPNLADLSGLSNLTEVYFFRIYNLQGAVSLAPFAGVTSGAFTTAGVSWEFNDSSISGLSAVAAPGSLWQLTLNNVTTPTGDLTGLENLTEVTGSLTIERGNLTSLNGLSGLTTIGGSLDIYNNNSLTTLAGFDNLTSLGGALDIWENDNLPQCEAEAFRDDLINNHGYTGAAYIENNDFTGVCN
jgi:hypothetical protein